MHIKIPLLLGAVLLAATLAGCSSSSPAASAGTNAAAASGKDAATGSTSLGTVIVDGSGHTAYFFDKDMKGEKTSACTGSCATTWPAITSASATPKVSGITGTVGTIPDGSTFQLTVNGLPIYTFAGDSASGDVMGQGVGGIWWAASPAGTKITTAASTGGY